MPRTRPLSRSRRLVLAVSAAGLAAAAPLLAAPSAVAAVSGGAAQNGFTAPVMLQGSAGLGEPSLAADSKGRLFATAPQKLGNTDNFPGGSPVWTSTDGGTAWTGPVRPQGAPVNGGDTDLAADAGDNVYQVDLWLGNSAMGVSTDHGASFVSQEYGHVQPGDDRPWLAYDPKNNDLYMAYDGVDAVHVAKTAPLADPHAGMVFPQDVPAVPECIAGGSNPCDQSSVRQCVCPPGGLAVDPGSGQVYVTYSRQASSTGGGVGIARSDNGGLTWTYLSIPHTGTAGAFSTEWNFTPVKVDSAGNVYVAWGEALNWDDTKSVAGGGVAIKYAYSTDHGATWSAPITVSTTTTVNAFPAMDVSAPGHVDIAWYGAPGATGDPNAPSPSNPTWNLYYATSSTALSANPGFAPTVAVAGIHTGCVQVGGGGACSDRSLLDFFQLVDANNAANIIYTAGDANAGTDLFFTKLVAAPAAVTAEVPVVPLMAVTAAGATALAVRRNRRRRRRTA